MLGLLQSWSSLSVFLVIIDTAFLKDQKKEKAKGAADQQALVLEKEIKDYEKKKNDLAQLVESLNGDFVKYSLTAANENEPKKMK